MVERMLSMHEAQGSIPCSSTFLKCARGLVVMIVACQVMDPGSIPGERRFCPQITKSTSGGDRTHANKVDQNLSLAP